MEASSMDAVNYGQQKKPISSQWSLWLLWLIASFFYLYQYIIRVLPSILMPEIMEKFQISAAIFGQFSGIYYIFYAGMHIPLGLLLDRVGPKVILPLCAAATGLGLLPLVLTDLWIFPVIGRALIGLGSSGAILGVFKVIRMCFPAQHFTRMLGISVAIGLLGALYGGQPLNYLCNQFGWQNLLYIICGCGLLLAVCLYKLCPALPKEDHATDGPTIGIFEEIFTVLGNYRVLGICILGGLMVGPLEGFADVWGVEFLKAVYQLPDSLAASLPSLTFVGMLIGSPVLSFIADKSKAYVSLIIFSALIMGCAFLGIIHQFFTPSLLGVSFFIVGIFCAYQIPLIYLSTTFVQERFVGLTTSVANMIIMFFGYFFHSSIGILLDKVATQPGQYTATDYQYAMEIIPVSLLISALTLYVFFKRKSRA